MGYQLRYPMITGATEKEQLAQIKSFLHQLVEDLQWSLNDIDKIQIQYVKAPTKSESAKKIDEKGTQATFDSIKSLIMESNEIINAYYENINARLNGVYVAQTAFNEYSEETESTLTGLNSEIKRLNEVLVNLSTRIADIEKQNSDTEWLSLGLSDFVAESNIDIGRTDGGCYYRVIDGKHVYISFNAAFTYGTEAIKINDINIPTQYCPPHNVYNINAIDTQGFASVLVNSLGEIYVNHMQSSDTETSVDVSWIDGYIEYWLETKEETNNE